MQEQKRTKTILEQSNMSKYPLPMLPLLPLLPLLPVTVSLDSEQREYDASTVAFIKACDTLSEACFKYARNPTEASEVREIFFGFKN